MLIVTLFSTNCNLTSWYNWPLPISSKMIPLIEKHIPPPHASLSKTTKRSNPLSKPIIHPATLSIHKALMPTELYHAIFSFAEHCHELQVEWQIRESDWGWASTLSAPKRSTPRGPLQNLRQVYVMARKCALILLLGKRRCSHLENEASQAGH